MTTLRLRILPLAASAWLLLAAPAFGQEGEEAIPPENSAVNQYTEPFPTAGGEKDAHGQSGRNVKPAKTLGARNAKRLEQRGPDGEAVAELTAETAPVVDSPEASATGPAAGNRGGGDKGDGSPAPQRQSKPAAVTYDPSGVEGSSGVGSVVSQALGSSSGGMGLLLPLLLLATIAWAIAYVLRQRRTVG